MLSKRLLIILTLIATSQVTFAYNPIALDELTRPKEPSYRVGISDVPENQYIEAQAQNQNEISKEVARITDKDNNSADVSYSDLTIKNLSKEISQELQFDEQDMVADLSLLWQGAAMQSDTINFALYKLANPDADKPNKSTVKNMLKTIASMSTLVGSAMANPLLAGTSFITGDVLGIMGQDTKALNYKYTKVTDADMIILIRKVEDLQQTAVNLYYDYMTSKKQLEMASKLVKNRQNRFQLAQKNNVSKEMLVITDAYYRTALDKQRAARAEFLSKRATLEQFVGNETFTQFEDELAHREENSKTVMSDEEKIEQDKAYNKTIQNVEEYTKSVTTEDNPYIYDDNSSEISGENSTSTEQENEELLARNPEKYSTKGLIFVHDNDRYKKEQWEIEAEQYNNNKMKETQSNIKVESTNEETTATDNIKKSKKKTKKTENNTVQKGEKITPDKMLPIPEQNNNKINNQKPQVYNGVELLPLEDIKVPERQFNKNGYSIFAE